MTHVPTKKPVPVRDRIRGQLVSDAVIGAVAWIVLFFVPITPRSSDILIERLLLFAPLVIVPLGVRLSARPNARGEHPLLYVAASYLHPLGAVMAVGSVLLAPGLPAGFAAGVWCAYCCVLAAWGVFRFVSSAQRTLAESAIDVGLVYIAVGGAWLVLSRSGSSLMNFSADIVTLTAVHFHYAGFAAPIIAGLAGRALERSGGTHVLWRIGVRAVIVGPIVIAIGITVSPLVEVVAAFALAIALTMLVVIVALRAAPLVGPLAGLSLWTCAASLSITMLMACAYAFSQYVGTNWLDIATMARVHGMANVFGFALPGMLAWTIAEPRKARV